ncbi:Response regulator of zinc sigma-54-dependent two-component system, partial [hydrothermal vent metagenome]
PDFSDFVGTSQPMKEVYQTITRLLDNDSTVLILGESGSGKELVANAIHYNSVRFDKPMVVVNCGAIPEELLESELFGHEKGAFTGAIRDRAGKFEIANKGTIFLDEIGDMSPNLQVKLLRVLQDQQFERVGGARAIKVDVRIIAATNKDLEKAMQKGAFREDLFYRLNVIPVEVPPLRERGDDVALITGHFIKFFNKRLKRSIRGISPEALGILKSYHWPGNVRELKHMIERLAVLKGEGVLEKADLPPKMRDIEPVKDDQLVKDMLLVGGTEELAALGLDKLMPQSNDEVEASRTEPDEPEPMDDGNNMPGGFENTGAKPPVLPEEGLNLKAVVEKYETTLILAALERCGWVKNKAAALLGLNRTTLVEKLKKRKLLNGLREDAAA